ncbi:unnamed protein product [Fusarium graminearum]|nr:unnamed protein product [Fusarium graminearum]
MPNAPSELLSGLAGQEWEWSTVCLQLFFKQAKPAIRPARLHELDYLKSCCIMRFRNMGALCKYHGLCLSQSSGHRLNGSHEPFADDNFRRHL